MKRTFKLLSFIISFSVLVTMFIINTSTKACADSSYKSKSLYLYDFNTDTELFAVNENKRLPIASMTKIMLLNLIYENLEKGNIALDEEVVASENASGMGGSQVYLECGGKYKVSELIKAITVASANDASVCMAERLYGSEENCVEKMNEKVKELGLNNTLFSNCTGIPKPMQYSTSKDIVMIFKDLIKHEKYFDYSNIWTDTIQHSKNSTEISNTNKLIKHYNGCDGGKTGFTNEAGFCLTATAKRGNMRLISAVIGALDSKTRFKECSDLLNYGFNTYKNVAVIDNSHPLEEKAQISNAKIKDIEVVPENSFFVIAKKNEKPSVDFKTNYFNLKAPIVKNDIIGEIVVYNNGVEVGKVNLLSNENVQKMNYFDYIKEISKNI